MDSSIANGLLRPGRGEGVRERACLICFGPAVEEAPERPQDSGGSGRPAQNQGGWGFVHRQCTSQAPGDEVVKERACCGGGPRGPLHPPHPLRTPPLPWQPGHLPPHTQIRTGWWGHVPIPLTPGPRWPPRRAEALDAARSLMFRCRWCASGFGGLRAHKEERHKC